MNKTITLFAISASLLLGSAHPTNAKPNKSTEIQSVTSPAVARNIHAMNISTMNPELVEQLRSRKAGSVKFWEAVSWCETNHDWDNSGYYAGGLGIAQSAWQGYGGREFAGSPKNATKEEQIVVANRISFFGYQTKHVYRTLDDKLNNKPFLRPAIGWRSSKNWGKNCVNWKTRKPRHVRFTEAGMVEYKESRSAPAQTNNETGKVSSQSLNSAQEVKKCPQWENQLKAQGLFPVAKFSYIMWRESRCQEKIVSKRNSNGSKDYGLLQINSSWKTITHKICGGTWGNMKVLLDSKCNMRVAKYLLDNGGLNHWSASSGNN